MAYSTILKTSENVNRNREGISDEAGWSWLSNEIATFQLPFPRFLWWRYGVLSASSHFLCFGKVFQGSAWKGGFWGNPPLLAISRLHFWRLYTPSVACNFMDVTQRLVETWTTNFTQTQNCWEIVFLEVAFGCLLSKLADVSALWKISLNCQMNYRKSYISMVTF